MCVFILAVRRLNRKALKYVLFLRRVQLQESFPYWDSQEDLSGKGTAEFQIMNLRPDDQTLTVNCKFETGTRLRVSPSTATLGGTDPTQYICNTTAIVCNGGVVDGEKSAPFPELPECSSKGLISAGFVLPTADGTDGYLLF